MGAKVDLTALEDDFVKAAKQLRRAPGHHLRRVAGGRRRRPRVLKQAGISRGDVAGTPVSRTAAAEQAGEERAAVGRARAARATPAPGGASDRPRCGPVVQTPAMSSIEPLGLST